MGDFRQAGKAPNQIKAASTQANDPCLMGLARTNSLWNTPKQTIANDKLYVKQMFSLKEAIQLKTTDWRYSLIVQHDNTGGQVANTTKYPEADMQYN